MKKKINKIIILCTKKYFEKKDYIMFSCKELKKQKYNMEIWTTVNWTFVEGIAEPENVYSGDDLFIINCEDEFKKNIKRCNMESTFFLIYPGQIDDSISIKIRKMIKINKGRYADYYYPLSQNAVKITTENEKPNNFLEVFKFYLKYNELFKLNRMLLSIFFPSTFNIVMGEAGYYYLNNLFDVYKKKTITLHNFDYDLYLEEKKKSKQNSCLINQVVFIDEFFEGHSDYKKIGIRPSVQDKNTYYKELNQFFSIIEKKYNCVVVIACHPKSEYKNNPYDGRKMYKNKTEELIRNSLFCIYQQSITLGLIMLYKKSYFFVVNKELLKYKRYRDSIADVSKILNQKILNLTFLNDDNIEEYKNEYEERTYGKLLESIMVPINNLQINNMYFIGKMIEKL